MGPRNLKKKKLQNRLEESKKFFVGEKYKTCISLASMFLGQGNIGSCEETLNKLPSKDQLLERLVSKLKGKSVYKTLKQIHEKDVDGLTKLKGISSLITHCVIEMQDGKREYGMLLPLLIEKEKDLVENV